MTPSPEVPAPLQDIPSYLARPQTSLTPAEAAALTAAHARLVAELGSFPARPLHGDAGAGNLMATGSGWVWHDFEDTCSGPPASPRRRTPRPVAAALTCHAGLVNSVLNRLRFWAGVN
jgi:hypothetical protein